MFWQLGQATENSTEVEMADLRQGHNTTVPHGQTGERPARGPRDSLPSLLVGASDLGSPRHK